MTAHDLVLEVTGLHYAYPDGHPALNGVDLYVRRGERVAVLGPNGAGKTTLALHLNGVIEPQAGRILVHGIELNRVSVNEIRRRVGIVFQDPDDQLFMSSVYEDVAFGPANLGLKGDALTARAMEALDAVGMAMWRDRPPHHLSFGQRRRVAIATVLAMDPDVVVLDEPTSNLDPAGRRELARVLGSLDQTIVMITHDLPYALEMCPRSVIMNAGVIVADGATSQLLSDEELLEKNRLELPYGFDPSYTGG